MPTTQCALSTCSFLSCSLYFLWPSLERRVPLMCDSRDNCLITILTYKYNNPMKKSLLKCKAWQDNTLETTAVGIITWEKILIQFVLKPIFKGEQVVSIVRLLWKVWTLFGFALFFWIFIWMQQRNQYQYSNKNFNKGSEFRSTKGRKEILITKQGRRKNCQWKIGVEWVDRVG